MTTDNFCFYLQNTLIQTSQTGGQQYSDTSPFSIPWIKSLQNKGAECRGLKVSYKLFKLKLENVLQEQITNCYMIASYNLV